MQAGFAITGDPAADSVGGGPDYWLAAGNSLQFGRYIRGNGNFSFDMYRAQFLVTQADGLQAATGWTNTDSVFALGGVIVSTLPGGFTPASTVTAVNTTNLTDSVRLVSKFTTSSGTFTPSALAPGAGNGMGSFSAGSGGVGSVLIATDVGQVTNAANSNPGAGAGVLTKAGVNQYYGLGGVQTITDNNARFIYKYDEVTQKLTSWEVFLNVTRLAFELTTASGNPGTNVPEWNGHWNQSLQRGTSDTLFTDAINQHMPLPPTLVALVGGAGLLGLGRRLRRGVAG